MAIRWNITRFAGPAALAVVDSRYHEQGFDGPKVDFAAEATAVLVLTRRDRALIQLGWAAREHNPGPADGIVGPQTHAALKAWQAETGKTATGYLTLGAMHDLMAAGAAAERKAKAQ